jgi:signal transduction histidine kinase
MTVELLVFAAAGVAVTALMSSGVLPAQLIEGASIDYAPTLRSYLSEVPPDKDGIGDMVRRLDAITSATIPLTFNAEEYLVVDSAGIVLGASPLEVLGAGSIGETPSADALSELTDPLQSALEGEEDVDKLYTLGGPGERIVMVVPVWDADHTIVLGALVGIGEIPTALGYLGDAAPIVGGSVLLFTAVAGMVGIVYGFLAARGPVARLGRITEASEAWGRGELSVTVEDSSSDELGQLARQLDQMAYQLQQLLDTRRELAVLKERNRLARDLHDTVKQLAFAGAAQIGTARTLINREPQAARPHIEEAERILLELREELSNLILELTPPVLADKGLAAALSEYSNSWSRQNEIAVDMSMQGDHPLPSEVSETVFRIVQEALANAARHSNARNVQINLSYENDDLRCIINDDGLGFDPSAEQTGFGLHSMVDRAAALGGESTVESQPGQGTVVTVSVPIDSSTEIHEGQNNG